MTLGENIFNLRKTQQLSQEQLAIQINVTRQTISNWENNITTPNVDQLKQISQLFHVSLDELLNNESNFAIKKMSNTEKLACMIMNGIKIIGFIFLILILLNILAFALFSNHKTDIKTDYSTQQIIKIPLV